MKYIIYLVVKKETCELLHFGYSKFDILKSRQNFFNSVNCTPNKAKQQAINNFIIYSNKKIHLRKNNYIFV